MQITKNATHMMAGISIASDKSGRDWCVCVIKGTFSVDANSRVDLSEEQRPLIYADEHYGDPGTTSIARECDFAPVKPGCDVLVVGQAVAPGRRPVTTLLVGISVGPLRKVVRVLGNRQWESRLNGVRPSSPAPFVLMPLVYDRAFGGSDRSHPEPKYQGTELRNPVGHGFHCNPDPRSALGMPLPNLEFPDQPLHHPGHRPAPSGFGCIGRGWQPRIRYGGTYDGRWRDESFPFLPADFDERYFQSAAEDQLLDRLEPGMIVRCVHMSDSERLHFKLPEICFTVRFRFLQGHNDIVPRLDTLIVEPDRRLFVLIWRCRVKLGRKLTALREVVIE